MPRGALPASGQRRILYNSTDGIARDLAERIVALAATDPARSAEATALGSAVPGLRRKGSGLKAEGVWVSELRMSLRDGNDFAYIIPVPRRFYDPCREMQKLVKQARWLSGLEEDIAEALVPLVDTRRHVIVRRDKAGLLCDWYGNVLVANEILLER
jgi:hypothetical protein